MSYLPYWPDGPPPVFSKSCSPWSRVLYMSPEGRAEVRNRLCPLAVRFLFRDSTWTSPQMLEISGILHNPLRNPCLTGNGTCKHCGPEGRCALDPLLIKNIGAMIEKWEELDAGDQKSIDWNALMDQKGIGLGFQKLSTWMREGTFAYMIAQDSIVAFLRILVEASKKDLRWIVR